MAADYCYLCSVSVLFDDLISIFCLKLLYSNSKFEVVINYFSKFPINCSIFCLVYLTMSPSNSVLYFILWAVAIAFAAASEFQLNDTTIIEDFVHSEAENNEPTYCNVIIHVEGLGKRKRCYDIWTRHLLTTLFFINN